MIEVVLIGTCDTKLDELLFLRSKIIEHGNAGVSVTMVDAGRSVTKHEHISVSQDTLTSKYAPDGLEMVNDISALPRGDLIKYMTKCVSRWAEEKFQTGLVKNGNTAHGIIGAGGTGNTSLVSAVMQALPIGVPKLIVSTAASGDTGPIVGEVDITMMYSVVDIAGMNSLLKRILNNAAGAIVGMATAYSRLQHQTSTSDIGSPKHKKRIGLTMFGVTTPCVDRMRLHLEGQNGMECFVFHCTGHGGKAMEKLIEQGELDAIIDLTTTEICDFLCDGVMSAGGHRLEAALKAGIPYIISVGATDMVNFGPLENLPERYRKRQLFEHNPTVTLMRTNIGECQSVARYIGEKIIAFAKNKQNIQVVLPKGGVSMISTPGQAFYDARADGALRTQLRETLEPVLADIELIEDDRDINDEGFAVSVAERMAQMLKDGSCLSQG